MAKLNPVFSVTWSFRNDSIPILCKLRYIFSGLCIYMHYELCKYIINSLVIYCRFLTIAHLKSIKVVGLWLASDFKMSWDQKEDPPSSSSWFGLGTSFRTIRISSLDARFLIALPTVVVIANPGNEAETSLDKNKAHYTFTQKYKSTHWITDVFLSMNILSASSPYL